MSRYFIRHEQVRSQVSSIEYIPSLSLLLYAMGSHLFLSSLSGAIVCKCKLFTDKTPTRIRQIKILAVTENSFKAFATGGNYVSIVSFYGSSMEIEETFEFKNFVLDISKNGNLLVVVQSLDYFSTVHLDTGFIEDIPSISSSLLYCSKVISFTPESFSIALGTIFSGVLLWNSLNRTIISLDHHKGSIFDIDFHEKLNLLASVSDDRSMILWPLDNTEKKIICYGHSARIWKCKFASNIIATVSEDCSCRIWNFKGDCIGIFEGHFGKNIWSLAFDPAQKYLFTGGGDSALIQWDISGKTLEAKYSVEDVSHSIRDFSSMGNGAIVSLSSGQIGLFSYDSSRNVAEISDSKQAPSFKFSIDEMLFDSSLHKYSCLANQKGLICCGNLSGDIFLFNNSCSYRFKIESGKKIHSIISCSSVFFAVVVGEGIYKIEEKKEPKFYQLEDSSDVAMCVCYHENDLFVGTRNGKIIKYSTESSSTVASFKESVTSLFCDGSNLFATARDGCFYTMQIQPNLFVQTRKKITKGWLEKICIHNDEIFLCGFFQKEFFLYDLARSYSVLRYDCGGAHRKWDFSFSSDGVACFSFLRQGSIFSVKAPPNNCNKIVDNFHGREIKSACLLKNDLIVTGGEDCRLILSQRIDFFNFS